MTIPKLATTLPKAHQNLERLLGTIPRELENKRCIDFTGGPVSICDLVAYQIGWGSLVIAWFETGIAGKNPEMPCKGFNWDYTILAKHFYKLHAKKDLSILRNELCAVVEKILEIITKTDAQGKLETLGHWNWCILPSGKEWPLAKWIQVNTVAPYTRAAKIIRQFMKSESEKS
jgi:hypothetical protein